MNSSENHSPTPGGSPIPPELEARLLAWIAGEASPFEIAELERLCREQPAVAAAKRELEQTHALLNEAARPDRTPLRLSAERRAKLLQEISTPAERAHAASTAPTAISTQPATPVASVVAMDSARRKGHQRRSWMLAAAACLTVGTFVAVLFTPREDPSSLGDTATAAHEETWREALESRRARSSESEETMRTRQARWAQEAQQSARKRTERVQSLDFELGQTSDAAPKPEYKADAAQIRSNVVDPNGAATSATLRGSGKSYSYSSVPSFDSGAIPSESRAEPTWGAPAEKPNDASALGGEKRRVAMNMEDAPARLEKKSKGEGPALAAPLPASPPPPPVKAAAALNKISDPAFAVAPSRQLADAAHGRDGKLADTPFGLRAAPAKPATVTDGASPVISEIFLKELAATNGEGAQHYDADTARESQAQKQDKSASTSPLTALAGTVTGADSFASETNESDAPLFRAPVISLPPLAEISAAKEPVSTFSLHVSDVSFRLAQKSLSVGQLPAIDTVRAEEFVNAFRYGDLTPAPSDKIACRIEQAAHPLRQQRNLVRIAAKVPSTGRGAGTPLRLTVLLDTSGSMEREDRAATVRAALRSLTSLLGPDDRITLLGFSRTTRLLADSVTGDQAAAAIEQLGTLPSEGGTNLEEALGQAGVFAHRSFDANAQNRVVLLTDGATNLGNARPAELANLVTILRQQRIAFDACGVGLDGLDDTVLEALTRQGDGRYYVLDTPDAADAGFARQLAGAFRPAAANVKVQVRFNPARVSQYRLLGFEKHRLNAEDFRNDAVDAAELAADEDATAVYEVEVLPQGEGELGDVFVRFRDTASGEMVERSWTMAFDSRAQLFDRASPTLQLAGTAALFAELLRNRPADLGARLGELAPVAHALRGKFPHDTRVAEFVTMFEQARRLAPR